MCVGFIADRIVIGLVRQSRPLIHATEVAKDMFDLTLPDCLIRDGTFCALCIGSRKGLTWVHSELGRGKFTSWDLVEEANLQQVDVEHALCEYAR